MYQNAFVSRAPPELTAELTALRQPLAGLGWTGKENKGEEERENKTGMGESLE